MNYETTKNVLLRSYPSIFIDEADILYQLFFTIGGGYEWIDGELIDRCAPEDPEEAIRRADEQLKTYLLHDLKCFKLKYAPAIRSEIQERLNVIGTPGYIEHEHTRAQKRQATHEDQADADNNKIYPLSQHSNIVSVPDNITPSWLEAVQKALKVATELEREPNDDEWLEKAHRRIEVLKKREKEKAAKKKKAKEVLR